MSVWLLWTGPAPDLFGVYASEDAAIADAGALRRRGERVEVTGVPVWGGPTLTKGDTW